jgi:hypothetical protein
MNEDGIEFIRRLITKLGTILLGTFAALTIMTEIALACSPAPSCWMESGPGYLRSVCLSYAKDHQTLKQIAMYLEEPEKIAAFGKACKKLGIYLKPERSLRGLL